METVGVEAIVKGLSSFLGGMGKMDDAITKLLPGTDLLSSAFGWLGDVISGFAGGALRVLEYTLGNLIADAIEAVISKIKELIGSIIDAGNEFQTLTIRLTGLNLDSATVSTEGYSAAMAEATKLTEEQVEWLQTLGAATPFDPTAISNVYTLARSYGFADDEARRLTKDTLEFSAGMGLTSAHLERVIQNFGQMVQRGKITSTEIRDLARGAFLPVNDVLERIVENSDGAFKDVAELQKEISKPGGGVPAQEFIDAFEQMVEEEPRFVGAAGRLGRAFIPATENIKELATSVFGLNIVKPVLDVLGEKAASMVDLFVNFNEQGDLIKTERWDALVAAATKLGDALSSVLTDVLGLVPSTEGLADGLIAGIDKFAQLILDNRDNIVSFFRNVGTIISEKILPFIGQVAQDFIGWLSGEGGTSGIQRFMDFLSGIGTVISEKIVPFVEEKLLPAWEQFSEWVLENKLTINKFFRSLGEIFERVVANFSGDAISAEGGVLGAITSFMEFVNNNQDSIVGLIDSFIRINIAVLELKVGIWAFVHGVTLAVATFWREWLKAWDETVEAAKDWWGRIKDFFKIGSPSKLFMELGRDIIDGLIAGLQSTVNYFQAIIDDGDYLNDWLTHLPESLQPLIQSIGEIFANVLAGKEYFQAIIDDGDYLNDWLTHLPESLQPKIQSIGQVFSTAVNWYQIGRNLITSIANGIGGAAWRLISAARDAAYSAYNAALSALGMHSPSTLFVAIGQNTMESMAMGIQNAAAKAAATMQAATMQVSAAAMAGTTNNVVNNNNTSNYNLTVNSSAQTEPVVQDFQMLSSLAGV